MRDTVTVPGYDPREARPLIPDPPIHRLRVKQRSNWCHQCWQRFTCCSKWTCIFITILVIVLVLIVFRSVLPFGWPWWAPLINFDAADPHIILIVADDIGWGDLGYGGAEFPTTNIDRLKNEGISLNRMYAHESGSATRSALLSGIPGYALGLQNGIDTGSNAHIPTEVKILPELLKEQRGYTTHMVGKWSLGYSKWEYTPTRRGFDSFLGFHQRYIDYWHYSATKEGIIREEDASLNADFFASGNGEGGGSNNNNNNNVHSNTNEILCGYDLWKDDKVYVPPVRMQYATELFDDEIERVIDDHANGENPDQPMFLYYTPPNAHAPIQYHYEYDNECSYIKDTSELIRWKYCNLMQELDASIGRLVDKLKEHEMWERSLVVFTSDNGGLMCWDVGSVNSCSGSVNLPLRGGKGTLFEGSIRVRSIVSGGYLDESLHGDTSEELMHSTDLFATLASAANIEHETIYGENNVNHVTGIPFWQYLTQKQPLNPHVMDGVMTPIDAVNIESVTVSDDLHDNAANGGAVVVAPPMRDGPFIADMQLDETSSYVEKAALFWKGYKYIIQPIEQYDGWWQSPLQGPSGLPDEAVGVHTEPQPLQPQQSGKQPPDSPIDPAMDLPSVPGEGPPEISWSSLRMNEYLFLIDDDPAETQNVGRSPEHQDILYQLREFLSDLAGDNGARDYVKQTTTTSILSDPSHFGNVWFPFEENWRE